MYRLHQILDIFRNKELDELYLSISLRDLALAMIGIFAPIYLLKLNYSFADVMIFHILMSVFTIFFTLLLVSKIADGWGIKHSMIYGIPVILVFFLMLSSIDVYNWPLWFISIFGGLSTTLFWTGYHIHFATFSKQKNRGEAISFSFIFRLMFHIIGPILGGIIMSTYGFKTLFLVVSFIFLLSIIPLLMSKDIHRPINFSLKQVFQDQKINDAIAITGYGAELALWIVWSIFIYLYILNDFTKLGLATSLVAIFMVVSLFIFGRLSDISRSKMLKIFGVLNSGVWFLKMFVTSAVHVNLVSGLYGLISGGVAVPFTAITYDNANKSNIVEYNIFREIMLHIGKIFVFLVVIFMDDIQKTFILGSVIGLLYLLF